MCLVSGGIRHASTEASAADFLPAAQEEPGAAHGVNRIAGERQPTFPYGKVCSYWCVGTDLHVGMLCRLVF